MKTNSPEVPFLSHLEEFRTRFIRCLTVFLIGCLLSYGFSEKILDFLKKPLFEVVSQEQQKLYFTHLFENFLVHLKIAGYASLFFLSPYYFYQLWAFVAPGLYPKEKRWVLGGSLAASVFFLLGACFAYRVLFPVGFRYFISYGTSSDIPLITMDAYYTTCLRLMLVFGLAFELPICLCFFGALGWIQTDFLKQHRRTAIVLIAFFSALFAPPDALSMLLLGGPLILFYELAIWAIPLLRRHHRELA